MFPKAIYLTAFLSVTLAPWGLGQDARLSGPASVIVLRNGGALTGSATYLGDHYLVRLESGGEISLKRGEVEFVCRDMAEAYLFKQRKLRRGDAEQRLDLAEWCLRHSLYSHAASELIAAMNLAPDNRRVASVERRLNLAVRPSPLPPPPASARSRAINMYDIEDEISQLDSSVVKHFRLGVQALLLNRCEKCHSVSADNGFRLLRPLKGQDVTRRTTQRNLHAALQLVDRLDPKSSRLITYPSRPHGGGETVLSERDQRQIKLLVQWATMVARTPKADRPSTIQRPDLSLLQNNEGGDSPTVKPAKRHRPPSGAASPLNDPFDPAEFNRRYSLSRLNAPEASAARN